MPKPRLKINKPLPKRWVLHHGAYYYRVPPGSEAAWDGKKKFRLGATLTEAHKTFSERFKDEGVRVRTVGDLLDRYEREVVPLKKSAATRQNNYVQIKRLRAVLGRLPVQPFPPSLVYKYHTQRTHKVAAKREIETLSHAYTKLVEWGEIDKHPFKGEVRLEGEAPRDRYVEDWEIIEVLSLDSKRKKGSVAVIKAYLKIKLLTGMGRGDLLRLEPARHFTEDGIFNQRHKTANKSGQRRLYEWTPALRAAVDEALAARPVDLSPYLFCTRDGKGYINEETGQPPGWKSMWQRFFARVIKETRVTEHFTEHDLRAKVGSDAESLEHAMELLAHADPSTTRKVYRRKTVRVRPLK